MSSVDDRIVNMQFNNKQFTQGVQQSQRDLTGLDKTLANAGKASGLGKMGDAATQVSTKFSAMQVAGVTAVATIANKVTLAAGSMLKKLTIQPIIDGFREYTTNLESVQTIMANTGKSVGTVNKYLDQMNEYADQTIYNFSQMAKNVGTFTAAGVELPKAVSAIKGISNLAALSGSNSQQASTAMYQLSQAIAAGKVGLQDWNSVVNAGMGGKVFKNALAQTAVAMGDLSSNAVKVGTDVEIMGQSFRNSIMATPGSESWLTSDVLVTTLATLDGRFSKTAITAGLLADGYTELQAKEMAEAEMAKSRIELAKQGVKFSDEEYKAMIKKADAAYAAATQIKTATQLFAVVQESIGSMWASAFRIILGDFKQSKELWGNVGDVVLGIVDNISHGFLGMLRVWEERGGRLKVIEGLSNIFGGLIDIFGAIAKGFDRAFPDNNVSMLNRLSKAFLAFSEYLVPSKDTLEDIGTIAEAVFSVLHFGVTIVKGITKGLSAFVGALFGATSGARGGVLSLVASIAEVIIAIEDWLTSGSKITRLLAGIGTVAGGALAPIVSLISSVVGAIAGLASGDLPQITVSIAGIKNSFLDFISNILNGLATLTSPFQSVSDFFADLASKVGGLKTTFSDVMSSLQGGGGGAASGGLSAMAGGLSSLGGILKTVGGFIKDTLGDIADSFHVVGDAGAATADKIGDTFGKVDDAASTVQQSTSKAFSSVSQSAGAAASGGVDKLASAGSAIKSIFSAIGGAIMGFFSSIGDGFGWIADKLSNIPWPQDALEWATLLNALLAGALIKRLFFTKGVLGTLKDTIEGMGRSFRIVSKAWRDSLDQLTDTLKTMQGAIKAEMIKNIAIAVALLVASLVILSYIPAEKLANGMAALSATMLMAGAMMQVMMVGLKKIPVKDLVKYGIGFSLVGVGMMAMATSVLILTAAVAALAFIPFDKLKQGLGAVAILMGIMTASLLLLSGQGAKVAAVGAAMALMAVAIDTMVLAVLALGVLPFDKLEQGLGAVAVGIGIMTASLLVLSGNSAKVLAAGGAMVLMATALNILIPLIVTMGLLPWDVVEQGLKAVAIGLGIMVGALLILSGNTAGVMGAAVAITLIAASLNILIPMIITLGLLPWEVVKQGLTAVAIGLGILVVAGYLAIGAAAGLQALSIVILAIGAAMFLAGTGMGLFAAGLALLAAVGVAAIGVITLAIGAFIALLPNIAIQVAAAFVTFLQAIALASPKIRKALGTIFSNILGVIDDNAPKIAKTLRNLVQLGLDTIVSMHASFTEAGFQIIMNLLSGLEQRLPDMVTKATDVAIAFITALGDNAVKFANAGADVLIETLEGLEDAVRTKGDRIREAARGLADALKDQIVAMTRDLFTSIPMPSLPEWIKNPSSILPDIPGMGRKALGKNGRLSIDYDLNMRGKGKKSFTEELQETLAAGAENMANAIERSVALLTGGNTVAAGFARQSDSAQTAAITASTRSEALDQQAARAEEKAQKQRDKAEKIKDRKKRQKALAKINGKGGAGGKAQALRRRQEAQARKAELAQAKADDLAAQAQAQLQYDSAVGAKDYRGAGDVRSQQGQDLTDRAQALYAEAAAKEKLAAKLANGNAKDKKQAQELRRQAQKSAEEANQLARDALAAQADAFAMYEKARQEAAAAVRTRMADIIQAMVDRDAERAWEKQFDELVGDDQKTKEQKQADMLNARAEANEKKAQDAREAMQAALVQAEALADTDAAAAQAQLDEAERQAQIANSAADSAEQDRERAEQLLEQATTASSNGTTTSGANITPSRTALEDAASAVDRYTSSLQQAEEQAGAGSTTTQFIQNNYSPEALSASQLYRQGKNLVSAAEVKMAGG